MKKYDLVNLKNYLPYKKYGLDINMHGIIIEILSAHVKVLFFNPNNLDEATLLDIDKNDIGIDKEMLPENIKNELEKNIKKIELKENFVFSATEFKLYDKVKLSFQDKKYTKLGLKNGDIGFVVDNTIIDNTIEVDFPDLDENSPFYGETFSININDLKKID